MRCFSFIRQDFKKSACKPAPRFRFHESFVHATEVEEDTARMILGHLMHHTCSSKNWTVNILDEALRERTIGYKFGAPTEGPVIS